jgi:endonuclease/exonuclease/phosphatase family metal-dependent hydrolase
LKVKISLCCEEVSSNLNLFLTHLEHISEKVRVQQIQEILEIIENWKAEESLVQDEGYLLLGDLNALSQQDYTETQWNNIIELKKEKNWLEGRSADLNVLTAAGRRKSCAKTTRYSISGI